ncbi:hypothetical protein E4T56_gene2705 [Termitomyces sp. T112]|nr:hypothetical protein E4T56_gene2705 [Termitomyces sp. T112]
MLIRGTLVTLPTLGDLQILQDHLLVISPTGYITHNAPFSSPSSQGLLSSSSDKLRTLSRGTFLLPTFVDLHLHAPQFLYQGTGLHLPLMQWLDTYAFKAEERLDEDPELAKRVYERLSVRLIENGTGSVVLFGTINEETNLILAKVMQHAGLRAYIGKLSMDIDIASRPTHIESSSTISLSAAKSFVHRCRVLTSTFPPHKKLVEPVLTPRFVPTCSDELLEGLGKLAAKDMQGLRIQSHLAEAADQVLWVQQTRGAEDIDVFDGHNLLTPHTIQAHCTFLPPPSLARLAERGTAIAHCPLSNAYFSSKPFPLKEALKAGVRVGLGTDVAGGYNLDIMNTMRWAVGVARMREGAAQMEESTWAEKTSERKESDSEMPVLDWKGALYLATRGGAEALGLGRGAGTFDIGAPFDAQLIQLFDSETATGIGNLDFFDLMPGSDVDINEEMIEKWWCMGDTKNRTGMWVQGESLGAAAIHY